MNSLLVFVDESLRPSRYLLGSVVVRDGNAGELRRRVNGLLMAGERRLHLQRESKRRRRQILDSLATLDLEGTVYTCRHEIGADDEEARGRCLDQVVVDIQATGSDAQLFIERREGADQRDRTRIIRARQRQPLLSFEHLEPHSDPLLWLPDCLAWAAGAGGEWAQRLSPSVRIKVVG